MSHILITGANGFVGRALALRLLEQPGHTLTLVDRAFVDAPDFGPATLLQGAFDDPRILEAALATPVDTVFHLASVPGGLAERQYAPGYQVNLQATMTLAHRLAGQSRAARPPIRLVFASSVAVYGPLTGAAIHEDQAPRPAMSYGAHKLMAEIALADLSRRGELDTVSLRLPGIVARPPGESGHGSAFMSLVMHNMAAGLPYACPVSPAATSWWMSLPCCVENLLHAAGMDTSTAPPARTWQLPVLQLSMEALLQALERRFGADRRRLISHLPDDAIETLFGRCPPLHTPAAIAAGFRHDIDADRLVASALA
ncbi:NAD-dependent epimerase/dehydratase family protein [Oxalobacteraceae bacterium]|nr:NAD-dependent epimerase/dehydratase family protein [Oxalobacteraceae bacterium]